MTFAGDAIGGAAFGGVAEVAAAIAAGAIPDRKAAFICRRLSLAFNRRGAEMALLQRPGGAGGFVNVRTVWAMTRSEELIGEVRQSDMTVFIAAEDVALSGFPLPLSHGDRVVRWPGLAREHVFTTLETPALYTIGDKDVLYRLIMRG